MKSAIAALALGSVGTTAFVTPNAVVGRVATHSMRQVCFLCDRLPCHEVLTTIMILVVPRDSLTWAGPAIARP